MGGGETERGCGDRQTEGDHTVVDAASSGFSGVWQDLTSVDC